MKKASVAMIIIAATIGLTLFIHYQLNKELETARHNQLANKAAEIVTQPSTTQQPVVLKATPSSKLSFKPEVFACPLLTSDGRRSGFAHLYRASDGVSVSYDGEGWSSLTLAQKALQKKLKRSVKILEQGPNIDLKGKKVGMRVLAVFPASNPNQEVFSVCLTNKSGLYSISSTSLRHVLEFESHGSR